jgi:hypothetical protein
VSFSVRAVRTRSRKIGHEGAAFLAAVRSRDGDGMTVINVTEQPRANPIEVVERMAAANDWAFQRASDDEITLVVRGKWTDYQGSFTWMFDLEALHFALAFELKVPERCQGELQRLMSMINEQLWVGHFDLWFKDGLVMYRNTLVLAGGVEVSRRQCEVLLSAALNACEQYYPAYQFVVWAGEGAEAALQAAMFETRGQA